MAAVNPPSLEDELTCPVCLMVPRSSPVHQCPAGHIVCGTCFADLDPANCPTCRAPMRDDHFSIVGRLIYTIPHLCKFSVNGCEEKKLLVEILGHEEYCIHQKMRCDVCGTADITISQFDSHNGRCVATPSPLEGNIFCNRLHVNRRAREEWDGVSPVVYTQPLVQFRHTVMLWDGAKFYIRVARRAADRRFTLIAAMEGSPEDCDRYMVTYSLENNTTREKKVVSVSQVVPVKHLFDWEMAQISGGSVGDGLVQKYVYKYNEEPTFLVHFEIKKW